MIAPKIADWYFDFVSPFAYLQSEQLAALAPRIAVRYRPVLFAGLLAASGQKGRRRRNPPPSSSRGHRDVTVADHGAT